VTAQIISPENAAFIAKATKPKPFKVTLGAIYGLNVDAWYFQSFMDLMLRTPPEGFAWADNAVVACKSGPLLSQARGHVLGNFAENTDADCLVYIDTDQVFTPELFWNLVACFKWQKEQVAETGIVAGVTWMSGHPKLETPLPNIWGARRGAHIGQYHILDTYPSDTILEVAACGFSNLVIGRDVATHFASQGINPFHHISVTNWEAMAQDFAGWDDPAKIAEAMRNAVWNADQLGEDLSACARIRDAGYRIFVNTNLEFPHSKTYLLDGDDYRRAVARAQEPVTP
jgi:hypothetical protein